MIEEKRLIKTMLSRKPQRDSFLVAAFMVLLITVVTLYDWRTGADLSASGEGVFHQHDYWRLLTSVLTHSDLAHLLSNAYMLFIFSFFIYGYFGIAVVPSATLPLAVLVNALAVLTYPPEMGLLGASGLVYLLGGFWLCLYFFIQRQYSVASRLLRVTGIALMVFFPISFTASTSYRTHAIGFLTGIITGAVYFYLNRIRIRSFEVYKTTLIEDVVYE